MRLPVFDLALFLTVGHLETAPTLEVSLSAGLAEVTDRHYFSAITSENKINELRYNTGMSGSIQSHVEDFLTLLN